MKSAKFPKTKPTIRFSAKLFRPTAIQKIGSLTFLTLPPSASAKLPSQSKTMIEGTINGLPFQTTLESNSKGNRLLMLNKIMHNTAARDAGETLMVEIMRVADEPETRIPADLRKALSAAPRAQTLWADITPIARRDWIYWISTAKQTETRKRRIETACSKLSSGKRRVCCFGGIQWLMKNSQPKK